jgi:hypothetical protein
MFWVRVASILAIIIVFSFLVDLLTDRLKSGRWKVWQVSLGVAVVLTLATLFVLQGHSVLFRSEANLVAKAFALKERMGFDKQAAAYLKDNFIFIDTAPNPELVSSTVYDEDDSAKHVVTNRHMLTNLFEFVNRTDSLFDLVVIDLVFTDPLQHDDKLLQQLKQLERSGKLVLAYNKDFVKYYPAFYDQFDVSSYGDVTKVDDEEVYFSHTLVSDGVRSLPYAMYIKLSPEKTKDEPGGVLTLNNFIPGFRFINEEYLFTQPAPVNTVGAVPPTDLQMTSASHAYPLGRTQTEDGQQEIVDLVREKESHHQNILFVANLSDPFIDKHSTPYGVLHGATILLNEFYALTEKQHTMDIGRYLLYVLALFIGYCVATTLVIVNCVSGLTIQTFTWETKYLIGIRKVLNKYDSFNNPIVIRLFKTVLNLLIDLLPFFLFILIGVLIEATFDRIVNMVGIFYFYTLLAAFLTIYSSRSGGPLHIPEPKPSK